MVVCFANMALYVSNNNTFFLYSILQECSYGQQYEPSQTRAGKNNIVGNTRAWEFNIVSQFNL